MFSRNIKERSRKSLRQFITDNPGLHGLRFSMSGYREQEWMTNVPLWAVKWTFSENHN